MKAKLIRLAVISFSVAALSAVGVHRTYADPNDSNASQPDTPPPPDQNGHGGGGGSSSSGGGAPSEGSQIPTPPNQDTGSGQAPSSGCGCGNMGGGQSGG